MPFAFSCLERRKLIKIFSIFVWIYDMVKYYYYYYLYSSGFVSEIDIQTWKRISRRRINYLSKKKIENNGYSLME